MYKCKKCKQLIYRPCVHTMKSHTCDVTISYWACPCIVGGPCMDKKGNDLSWLICSEPGCPKVFRKN